MRFRPVALATIVVASLLGCGGGSDSGGYAVTFTPSNTATAPRLVKLVQKSKSGGRVVVQVVIYGPDTTLDMYSFAFDVLIGDPNVLRFVGNSDVAGNALVATGSQSIRIARHRGRRRLRPLHRRRRRQQALRRDGERRLGLLGGRRRDGFRRALGGDDDPHLGRERGKSRKGLRLERERDRSITFDTASASVQGTPTGGGGY
jgi:hypothetical protein